MPYISERPEDKNILENLEEFFSKRNFNTGAYIKRASDLRNYAIESEKVKCSICGKDINLNQAMIIGHFTLEHGLNEREAIYQADKIYQSRYVKKADTFEEVKRKYDSLPPDQKRFYEIVEISPGNYALIKKTRASIPIDSDYDDDVLFIEKDEIGRDYKLGSIVVIDGKNYKIVDEETILGKEGYWIEKVAQDEPEIAKEEIEKEEVPPTKAEEELREEEELKEEEEIKDERELEEPEFRHIKRPVPPPEPEEKDIFEEYLKDILLEPEVAQAIVKRLIEKARIKPELMLKISSLIKEVICEYPVVIKILGTMQKKNKYVSAIKKISSKIDFDEDWLKKNFISLLKQSLS